MLCDLRLLTSILNFNILVMKGIITSYTTDSPLKPCLRNMARKSQRVARASTKVQREWVRVSGKLMGGMDPYLPMTLPINNLDPAHTPNGHLVSTDTLGGMVNIHGFTPSIHQLFVNSKPRLADIRSSSFINLTTLFYIRLFAHSN